VRECIYIYIYIYIYIIYEILTNKTTKNEDVLIIDKEEEGEEEEFEEIPEEEYMIEGEIWVMFTK
jgi:amino acid permease